MRLNHTNLTVTDVLAASEFLERYFGLHLLEERNAGLTVMMDSDGFVLTLMRAGRTTEVKYPGNFHIGFFVESEAIVDEINCRLKDDGYKWLRPSTTMHIPSMEAPGGSRSSWALETS